MYISGTYTEQPEITGEGLLHARVTFSGDSGESDLTRDFTANSLTNLGLQVAAFRSRLNQVQSDAQSVKSGETVNEPAVEVTEVDPNEESLNQIITLYNKIQQLVTIGALDPADKLVTDIRDTAKSAAALVTDNLSTQVATVSASVSATVNSAKAISEATTSSISISN